MAYTPDLNTLVDGPRHVIVRATAISDGTSASSYIIIDKSTLTGPNIGLEPSKLAIEEIWYSIQGYEAISLYWDHVASDTLIANLSLDGYIDFRSYGGLTDDGSTGTGDIIWAYAGGGADAAGDTFTITIKARKKQ